MSIHGTLFATLLAANARNSVITAVSSKFTVKQVEWSANQPKQPLLVLYVSFEGDEDTVFDELLDLIRNTGVLFHSLVLVSPRRIWWQYSNIDYSKIEIPPEKEEEESQIPKDAGRHSLITQDD